MTIIAFISTSLFTLVVGWLFGAWCGRQATWDARPTHKRVCTLLDETIQLRCFDRESRVADLIVTLRDPTVEIERCIERTKDILINYKAKLNDYN